MLWLVYGTDVKSKLKLIIQKKNIFFNIRFYMIKLWNNLIYLSGFKMNRVRGPSNISL